MADTRYLDWPFFEPRHAELARTLDDWAGRHIADTHGADVDAECRASSRPWAPAAGCATRWVARPMVARRRPSTPAPSA
jgi:hypothetical protein